MGFAGDPVPHLPLRHVFAYGYNVACGLMADDQRGFGVDLAPLVPFHDVHIRTADGGTVYFDQHLVIAGFRDGEIGPVDELSGLEASFTRPRMVFAIMGHLSLSLV